MSPTAWIVCLTLAATALVARAAEAPKFELKDGDRLAFVGNTFVEREQAGDYIETMLLSRFPDRNVTFRNLGYSGDTTTGEARGLCTGWSSFETADKGFARLKKLVGEFKPTVILVNYGMTESFFGSAGLPQFVASYNKMLGELASAAGATPRFVLMSPNYHEDLGRPLPDPAEHNKSLKLYADAIAEIANKRGALFVDLLTITKDASKDGPLTSNGIHLTPYGYWRTALALQSALDLPGARWQVTPAGDGYDVSDALLPSPAAPTDAPQRATQSESLSQRLLQVPQLKPGNYRVQVDGKSLATGSAEDWARGVAVPASDAELAQVEQLRRSLVAKDFDYFNYQRPENDSYILAFRKHEQGRNAVEIPQFLPLVEQKEKEIATLRVPRPVKYTLQAVK